VARTPRATAAPARETDGTAVTMADLDDTLERIRRGYHALGLGAHRDVVAMFEGEALDREGGEWVVIDLVDGHRYASREPVAMDLFGGLPPHWQLVGVDVEHWRRGPWRRFSGFGPAVEGVESLVVSGHYRARPRSTDWRWDVERVPFIHVWRLVGARVTSVSNYLDAIEVRRLPAAA
jgi:hypothetical protein